MGRQRNDTKEAKALLAAYCPTVANIFIKVFGMLPLNARTYTSDAMTSKPHKRKSFQERVFQGN